MSDLIVDFQQQGNWSPLWDGEVEAQPINGNTKRRVPIRTVSVPVLVESKIIALFINSKTAAPHWKFAGMLRQVIPTGLTVGGITNATLDQRKVYLYRINLLVLPKLTSEYALYLDVPYWIVDLQMSLFEYTGLIGSETATTLNNIQEDVSLLMEQVENLNQA